MDILMDLMGYGFIIWRVYWLNGKITYSGGVKYKLVT
jgi:hypothetical protein